jgi:hypothetical protein
MAVSVVRLDTALALYNDKDSNANQTMASMLLISYKLTPRFAPFVRLGAVFHWPIADAEVSLVNPAVGATYGLSFSHGLKLGLVLGVALPFGRGGGNQPNPAGAAATRAGVLARSAMDNAMFAVNYLTLFPGVGLAWVGHGVTVQAEATFLQLIRVRGDLVDTDAARSNLTMGLHVGYFFIPQLSIGGELRYQVWLSTPSFVAADPTGTQRDNLSLAVGLRGHFKVAKTVWFRPGIAYARGLDAPMSDRDYNIIQFDLPVVF